MAKGLQLENLLIRILMFSIMTTDINTRKLLTMRGGFPPKTSTLRLYTKRKEGGQGLMSLRATIKDERTKIQEHVEKMARNDDLLSEWLRQQ